MNETGIGIRNPLFFIGVVENNVDKRLEGRVQVRAFSIHGKNKQDQVPTEDLPWAVCAAGNYSPNNAPPKLNSFVYGMFLDGREAQHPLILGLIPAQFTEVIDPEKNGWGVIPLEDGDVSAHGSDPKNFGKAQNSPLARGEDLSETYILAQEMNRVEGAKIAGTDETWDEPGSAYAAKYPYNNVTETACHSMEMDDTPGAERVMIRHKSGSYIQMDASGNVAYKSTKDTSDVRLENENVYVGGKSVVHIHGDSHVYVHGNKTEEVNGDYRLLVHGNAEFGVGGQMNLNASDQVQMRGADVKIEANVSTLTLKAKRNCHIGGDESILLNSLGNINQTAVGSIDMFATLDFNVTAIRDFTTYSSNIFQTTNNLLGPGPELTLAGATRGIHINNLGVFPVNIQTIGVASIKAPIANIDTIVNLGTGTAAIASFSLPILPNYPPTAAVMPEPPRKSTSITGSKKSGNSVDAGINSVFDDKIS